MLLKSNSHHPEYYILASNRSCSLSLSSSKVKLKVYADRAS
ncbi:hypothetical protein RchiOBHm_Chr4g0417721 [Rosa chinensis]|uniref:Uncharacterized protein n=1 Tax=Rosa chinensis TaxID=74649 RepID=A0A2P6QX57_ROSCH|nr:hypothetical protein RchiOBHm_Chr4g0417721 [Rosa chinensis]